MSSTPAVLIYNSQLLKEPRDSATTTTTTSSRRTVHSLVVDRLDKPLLVGEYRRTRCFDVRLVLAFALCSTLATLCMNHFSAAMPSHGDLFVLLQRPHAVNYSTNLTTSSASHQGGGGEGGEKQQQQHYYYYDSDVDSVVELPAPPPPFMEMTLTVLACFLGGLLSDRKCGRRAPLMLGLVLLAVSLAARQHLTSVPPFLVSLLLNVSSHFVFIMSVVHVAERSVERCMTLVVACVHGGYARLAGKLCSYALSIAEPLAQVPLDYALAACALVLALLLALVCRQETPEWLHAQAKASSRKKSSLLVTTHRRHTMHDEQDDNNNNKEETTSALEPPHHHLVVKRVSFKVDGNVIIETPYIDDKNNEATTPNNEEEDADVAGYSAQTKSDLDNTSALQANGETSAENDDDLELKKLTSDSNINNNNNNNEDNYYNHDDLDDDGSGGGVKTSVQKPPSPPTGKASGDDDGASSSSSHHHHTLIQLLLSKLKRNSSLLGSLSVVQPGDGDSPPGIFRFLFLTSRKNSLNFLLQVYVCTAAVFLDHSMELGLITQLHLIRVHHHADERRHLELFFLVALAVTEVAAYALVVRSTSERLGRKITSLACLLACACVFATQLVFIAFRVRVFALVFHLEPEKVLIALYLAAKVATAALLVNALLVHVVEMYHVVTLRASFVALLLSASLQVGLVLAHEVNAHLAVSVSPSRRLRLKMSTWSTAIYLTCALVGCVLVVFLTETRFIVFSKHKNHYYVRKALMWIINK